MSEQLYLFDVAPYDKTVSLKDLETSILLCNWRPFSIDKLQKASKMYGISCETIWNAYENLVDEKQEAL